MLPVDLRKDSSSKSYYLYSALIHSGITYNFIFLSIVDKLGFEMIEAGRSNVKKKVSPPITTVTSEPLRSTMVIWQMVALCDGAGTK